MKIPIAPLSELCDMDRQGLRPDDPKALELPFVGVENVDAGTGILNYDTNSRVGSQRSTAFRFDERHVLYAKLRPYLNKVATPGFAGKCSTELVPLLPREGVDRDFVAHLLRRTQTVEYVMATVTGSRMPRTDMKALMTMRVPLPPLNEQRRIADILNRAAKIERLRARAAERLREFIPALFIRMFGDPVENPMGWAVGRLGEICTINPRNPRAKKSGYSDNMVVSFVPMIAVDERAGAITIREERPLAEVSRGYTSFKDGDVLFAKITPCMENGKAALARNLTNGIGRGSTEFYVVRPGDRVLGEYIYHFVRQAWFREEAKRNFTGTAGQQRVPKTFMENALIPLPPLDEQRRIVGILNRAAKIGRQAETATVQASALTASLMSRLLGDAV